MTLRTRLRALLGVGVVALVAAVAAPAQPASAAPLPINMSGDVDSHLAALINADITFPATFVGDADLSTGAVQGTFDTEPGTLRFSALGLLPVETGVDLHFTEPVTGTVDVATLEVDVTATFEIELTSFSLLGIPMLDPNLTCRTVAPITAELSGTLDPATGIVMTGSYTIPAFQDCGFMNDWITMFTSGPGHTIETTLGLA